MAFELAVEADSISNRKWAATNVSGVVVVQAVLNVTQATGLSGCNIHHQRAVSSVAITEVAQVTKHKAFEQSTCHITKRQQATTN